MQKIVIYGCRMRPKTTFVWTIIGLLVLQMMTGCYGGDPIDAPYTEALASRCVDSSNIQPCAFADVMSVEVYVVDGITATPYPRTSLAGIASGYLKASQYDTSQILSGLFESKSRAPKFQCDSKLEEPTVHIIIKKSTAESAPMYAHFLLNKCSDPDSRLTQVRYLRHDGKSDGQYVIMVSAQLFDTIIADARDGECWYTEGEIREPC